VTPVLQTSGLTVTFGGLHAVDDLDLFVHEGTLVGLIGPNGAGKTTAIDAITGFVAHKGRVMLNGQELGSVSTHERARLGLGRTWQSLELFDDLTVRENLQVAAEEQSVGGFFADLVAPARSRDTDLVDRMLELVGLADLADRMPGEVSQGQRKLVGVARALAARPDVVCMDEPAAGLDSEESRALGRELRKVVEDGTSILLVDHDMGLVLEVCDYVFVIDFGHLIAAGTPAEVQRNSVVIDAYLGADGHDKR
jgi:branched-chain amino acid transport system ATP-binding protein